MGDGSGFNTNCRVHGKLGVFGISCVIIELVYNAYLENILVKD